MTVVRHRPAAERGGTALGGLVDAARAAMSASYEPPIRRVLFVQVRSLLDAAGSPYVSPCMLCLVAVAK